MHYFFALMIFVCDCVNGMKETVDFAESCSDIVIGDFKYDEGKKLDEAIISAIEEGDYEALLPLVNKQNVCAVDSNGNTLLHLAVKIFGITKSTDSNRIINLLLRKKVNINAENNEGHSALYEACCLKNPLVTGTLLNNGAEITDAIDEYVRASWPLGLEILETHRFYHGDKNKKLITARPEGIEAPKSPIAEVKKVNSPSGSPKKNEDYFCGFKRNKKFSHKFAKKKYQYLNDDYEAYDDYEEDSED